MKFYNLQRDGSNTYLMYLDGLAGIKQIILQKLKLSQLCIHVGREIEIRGGKRG
jgi:hypothetical protein